MTEIIIITFLLFLATLLIRDYVSILIGSKRRFKKRKYKSQNDYIPSLMSNDEDEYCDCPKPNTLVFVDKLYCCDCHKLIKE